MTEFEEVHKFGTELLAVIEAAITQGHRCTQTLSSDGCTVMNGLLDKGGDADERMDNICNVGLRMLESMDVFDFSTGSPLRRLECRRCGKILGVANQHGAYLMSRKVIRPPARIPCPACGTERRLF